MKTVLVCFAAFAAFVALAQAQVNVESYSTNTLVTVSNTTPTLLDAARGGRVSLGIFFATNSPAGIGVRFFAVRPDLSSGAGLAAQTNAFKAGTIAGRYINPAGTFGSIIVPVGWNFDGSACPATAVYGLSDPGGTAIMNVNAGLPSKP